MGSILYYKLYNIEYKSNMIKKSYLARGFVELVRRWRVTEAEDLVEVL